MEIKTKSFSFKKLIPAQATSHATWSGVAYVVLEAFKKFEVLGNKSRQKSKGGKVGGEILSSPLWPSYQQKEKQKKTKKSRRFVYFSLAFLVFVTRGQWFLSLGILYWGCCGQLSGHFNLLIWFSFGFSLQSVLHVGLCRLKERIPLGSFSSGWPSVRTTYF